MAVSIEDLLVAARQHTDDVIKPNVDAWNEAGVWPRAASDKAASLGLTELEASRLLYRAAANALGTDEGPLMAAHAKRFVPDAAVKAANSCTQVLGGMGLLKPYGLDRLSRLSQMLRIVDGTTEISRVVIGRALQKRAEGLPDLPIPKGFGEG